VRSIAIQQKQTIIYPQMPLAIYRELASHLQQVQGVETHLTPQQFQQFDYHQSQIGSLEINYTETFQESDRLWSRQFSVIMPNVTAPINFPKLSLLTFSPITDFLLKN